MALRVLGVMRLRLTDNFLHRSALYTALSAMTSPARTGGAGERWSILDYPNPTHGFVNFPQPGFLDSCLPYESESPSSTILTKNVLWCPLVSPPVLSCHIRHGDR